MVSAHPGDAFGRRPSVLVDDIHVGAYEKRPAVLDPSIILAAIGEALSLRLLCKHFKSAGGTQALFTAYKGEGEAVYALLNAGQNFFGANCRL